MRLVSVAVPVPFLEALSYNVPDHLTLPCVGARVRVPVGSRTLTGCVIEQGAALDSGAEARDILETLDSEPLLPATIVELCRWVAEYYVAGIGDAIGVAMPPGARRKASGFKTRRIISVTAHGLAQLGPDRDAGVTGTLTRKQREALEMLAAAAVGLGTAELRDRGISGDLLTRLAARGLVAIRREQDERNPFEGHAQDEVGAVRDRALTAEQVPALERLSTLADARTFGVALLHGVTGSGKTEIYLRLADRVRQAGRQVLLMVPEIALTPSVAALFRGSFGDRVAVQHSALSDGERHDQWQRIRRGDIDVVVGTRSAVFAPLTRLGLIVVDEEHDGSYKQEETPRYHGRDVAVMRANRERALVVLGSATPSMETYQNAVSGKYLHLRLERRVLDRPLADVRLVNMRDEFAAEGPDIVVSRELVTAVEQRLARGEQALVLLNRRGYSTAVFCRQCGDTFECPNCSVSLTVHAVRSRDAQGAAVGVRLKPDPTATGATEVRLKPETTRTGATQERLNLGADDRGAADVRIEQDITRALAPDMADGPAREAGRRWRARCHYCNYTIMVPTTCRKCAAPYLQQTGFGTEKVEQHLRERFPEARIGRIDRDSVRRKGALASLLSKFAAGELDLIVGTQMIAKGHDFPRVTLVGVISADVGLGLADFRAGERTFQLLTQVAGRAGRGDQRGEAIVQTLYPDHYSIQLACRQDYPAFFDRELTYRRAMRYPPLVALVNVIARGRTFQDAMQTAGEIVRRLEPAANAAFTILGPAPAPLGRLRGEHRVQFFLKGTRRADMRNALKLALDQVPEIRRKVTVDVDPLSVL